MNSNESETSPTQAAVTELDNLRSELRPAVDSHTARLDSETGRVRAAVEANGSIDSIVVRENTTFLEVLERHSGSKAHGIPAGIVLVVDDTSRLIGTITDGDIRRGILSKASLDGVASEIMSPDPIVFNRRMSFQEILRAIPKELRRRGRFDRKFLGKIVLVDDAHRPVRVLDYHRLWEQRVATHRHVTVIGLGYVGLTLAITLADSGYSVTGVDSDDGKIAAIQRGELYVHEVGLPALLNEHLDGNLTISSKVGTGDDVFIVCVGTPLSGNHVGKIPSLDQLRLACEAVGPKLGVGSLVILRSTVPVGTTREFVRPLLEELSGLRAGDDFHLVFAPERTVEGNALRELLELPQIIGGVSSDCIEAAAALFRELNANIIRVSSCEAAEMAKLLNNCYRDLIFSFSNEMALLAVDNNIDIVEVIRASNSSYPRDRIPLPSPGVGGPCLTKDPYILASSARAGGESRTLGEHGRLVHQKMVESIAARLISQLERLGKSLQAAKILICGLAFKGRPETADLRDAPAIELCRILSAHRAVLYGHDPVAPPDAIAREGLIPVTLPEGFAGMDAVIFMNNHPSFEKLDVFAMVRSLAPEPVLFDGWNLFDSGVAIRAAPCVYLGISHMVSSIPRDT